MAPTLTDIAQKAGVSTAKVSRCLNTPDHVARHTRGRVEDVITTLSYTLLVARSSYDSKIEEEKIRILVSRGAHGFLLIEHDRSPEIIDYLEAQDIPTLVAWAHAPD